VSAQPGEAHDLFVESGAGELDVTLSDAGEAVLVEAATDSDSESVRYPVPADATLLVEVFERGGDADGEYSLFSSALAPGPCGVDEDAFEPNDVRADATAFGSDGPRDGWVCAAPDVFEVHVPASSPDPLEATVTVASGAGDLDVGLYDSTGALVDGSTGTTGTETVGIASPVTEGSYFVEVYGYQGGTGGYTLEVDGASTATVVHGTVTTWDPSTWAEVPAEGAVVSGHDASVEGDVAAEATDGAGGYGFDFGQLPAGTYRFEVEDPTGTSGVWATEWYDQAADHGSGTDVTVTTTDQMLDPVLLQLVIDENPFTDDVSSSYWAVDAIRYVWTYRIAEGIDATHFDPSASITRAQLTRMLYRLAGSPEPCDENYAEPFTDVSSTHWARDAITWATCDPPGAEDPIATGITSTTFAPEPATGCTSPCGLITRAQTARMVYRLAGSISTSGLTEPFTDVSPTLAAWALDAVKWVYWDADDGGPLTRLMSGITSTTFVPNDLINRAQAASLLGKLSLSEPHWGTGSSFWQDPSTVPGSSLFR